MCVKYKIKTVRQQTDIKITPPALLSPVPTSVTSPLTTELKKTLGWVCEKAQTSFSFRCEVKRRRMRIIFKREEVRVDGWITCVWFYPRTLIASSRCMFVWQTTNQPFELGFRPVSSGFKNNISHVIVARNESPEKKPPGWKLKSDGFVSDLIGGAVTPVCLKQRRKSQEIRSEITGAKGGRGLMDGSAACLILSRPTDCQLGFI